MPTLPVLAGMLGLVAVASAFGERAQRRRRDLDRIGPLDWRTVQLIALIGLTIIGGLALHS